MTTTAAATERPTVGSTVRVQIPGKPRAYEYVVVEHSDLLPGAFRAARPSRKHPGDYFGGFWLILPEWVVS